MTAIKAKRPLRSLLHAKANFCSSIRVGIDELMTRAGYSRERATQTLLRELAGRSGGEVPTDQEVRFLSSLSVQNTGIFLYQTITL